MIDSGEMQIAYIGIGANLGDPQTAVSLAINALADISQTRLQKYSSLYRTAPVGYLDQPDFINAVAQVCSGLSPMALLEQLLLIETRFGRERSARNGPRTLDLDLLLYGSVALDIPGLTLPHPRMAERAFVLVPLAEIAPDVLVGERGAISRLLEAISTESVIRIGNAQVGEASSSFLVS